jgi:UDP-N-acetylmuramate--alanine ligase
MDNSTVHFIGIGGIGMSGIAFLLLQRGVAVSGSDEKDSRTTAELRAKGARIEIGHRASNVEGAGEVVFSSAIREDNPEMVEARRRGLRILHRSEKLADLVNSRRGITVAGTHGKTTTTSMTATVLSAAGIVPSYVVGGIIKRFSDNARASSSDWIVVEADESDGSLVNYRPEIAVLTNAELDHTDFYKDLAQLDAVYATYLGNIKPGGHCIHCADDAGAARIVAAACGLDCASYGLVNGADISARNLVHEGLESTCEVFLRGERLGPLRIRVPGRHNVQNSMAAVAVGLRIGLSFEQVRDGLEQFGGVERRFQIAGQNADYIIVEDYAHHPSEIRATLAAARLGHKGRIIAAFQPHRYTRTQSFAKEFGAAFGDADGVVITDVYAASEDPIPGVGANLIMDSLAANGHDSDAHHVPSAADVEDFLAARIRPGDMVLILGAGDIAKVAKSLALRMIPDPAPVALA